MDEDVTELDVSNNESREYKVENIWNSAVYVRESESSHFLLWLYYLVSSKGYQEEENTWEPALAV